MIKDNEINVTQDQQWQLLQESYLIRKYFQLGSLVHIFPKYVSYYQSVCLIDCFKVIV